MNLRYFLLLCHDSTWVNYLLCRDMTCYIFTFVMIVRSPDIVMNLCGHDIDIIHEFTSVHVLLYRYCRDITCYMFMCVMIVRYPDIVMNLREP